MNVRETPRAPAHTVEWEFAQSTYASVLADVPAALFPFWARTAHQEFPGIPRDACFFAQAAEGLTMFFDCAASAGRPCALPSRAADSVWHAWTRLDAPGLERFCIRHVGRAIAHLGRADMQPGEPHRTLDPALDPGLDPGLDPALDRALAVCLVQARRRASQPAAGSHLPRLFRLDGQLGMPRGFGYRIIGGLVACSLLDEFGNPEGKLSFPGSLRPCALYLAGLVSEAEYAEAVAPGRAAALVLAAGMDEGAACGDGVSGDGDGGAPCGSAYGSACGSGG